MYHVLEFNNVCSNSLFIIVEVLWKVFKKWRLKVYETVKKSIIISIATKSDIGTTERKQRKAKFKTKKKSTYSNITSVPMQSFKFNGEIGLNA